MVSYRNVLAYLHLKLLLTVMHYFVKKFIVVAFCATPSSCTIKGDTVHDMVLFDIVIPFPEVRVFCFAASRVFKLVVSVYPLKVFDKAVLVI